MTYYKCPENEKNPHGHLKWFKNETEWKKWLDAENSRKENPDVPSKREQEYITEIVALRKEVESLSKSIVDLERRLEAAESLMIIHEIC